MTEQAFPALRLQLFGGFQAQRGGLPLPHLHLREGERLLAYLALHSNEPVSSRQLAEQFWPSEAHLNTMGQGDYPNVRQALHSLRQALGPDAARLTRPYRGAVILDAAGLDIDVHAFDRLACVEGEAAWAAYAEAVSLYQGPLLAAWDESWLIGPRLRRRRDYETLLRRLTQRAWEQERHVEAERWTQKLLESRPDDEDAQRDLLRLRATFRPPLPKETREQVVVASLVARSATPAPEQNRPTPAPETALEAETLTLDVAGGAVPLLSRFYIARDADARFHDALTRQDSIVLVKGTRQVGKTSLMARGLKAARQAGARVLLTDFQKINAAEFASPDALYRALAASLALQGGVSVSLRDVWDDDFGPNMNLERFLCSHVLPAFPEPVIWAMDESDRLLACPFGSEVFGLFRSWYNERSLNPDSVLSRLTMVIAYATEAHLFITDLNQSPFNVGTRLTLADFTQGEVTELNRRYRSPLGQSELALLQETLGGQPYLTRRTLDEAASGVSFARVLANAGDDDGLFGDHLRRLWLSVSRSPHLLDVLRDLLTGQSRPAPDDFYRLRASGLLTGGASQDAAFRCRLYETYFARQFGQAS